MKKCLLSITVLIFSQFMSCSDVKDSNEESVESGQSTSLNLEVTCYLDCDNLLMLSAWQNIKEWELSLFDTLPEDIEVDRCLNCELKIIFFTSAEGVNYQSVCSANLTTVKLQDCYLDNLVYSEQLISYFDDRLGIWLESDCYYELKFDSDGYPVFSYCGGNRPPEPVCLVPGTCK